MEEKIKYEGKELTGNYERIEKVSSGAIKIIDEQRVSNGAICIDFD